MKSSKAIRSRVRTTKKGAVLARGQGRGHFNAKHPRSKKLKQKRITAINIPAKMRQRYSLT